MQDFSPYLTKIKYQSPDLVVSFLNTTDQAITINKQGQELGGWGSIKYFNTTEVGSTQGVLKMPSTVGIYTVVMWLPGSDDPGMKAFEDAFKQKYGRTPGPASTHLYNTLWIAIKAIELAGTDDPIKLQKLCALVTWNGTLSGDLLV